MVHSPFGGSVFSFPSLFPTGVPQSPQDLRELFRHIDQPCGTMLRHPGQIAA